MKLVIDHRETRSGVAEALRKLDADIEIATRSRRLYSERPRGVRKKESGRSLRDPA